MAAPRLTRARAQRSGACARNRKGDDLEAHHFDHEKRDVDHLALEYVVDSLRMARGCSGLHRHSRDPWVRGSAVECAAFQDVLEVSGGMAVINSDPLIGKLNRLIAKLTGRAMRSDRVSESPACYNDIGIDYEHEQEHRIR